MNLERLHRAFDCPVCGQPMIHARLRGYYCWNERHNEIRREKERMVSEGKLSIEDYERWRYGESEETP